MGDTLCLRWMLLSRLDEKMRMPFRSVRMNVSKPVTIISIELLEEKKTKKRLKREHSVFQRFRLRNFNKNENERVEVTVRTDKRNGRDDGCT